MTPLFSEMSGSRSEMMVKKCLLLVFIVFTTSPCFANDAYLKARVKSLSQESQNYNYFRIRSQEDLNAYLKKKRQLGIDVSNTRGYAKVINYGTAKNVCLEGVSNLGVILNSSNGEIINKVAVDNVKSSQEETNYGVSIQNTQKWRSISSMTIDNDVNIKDTN